MSSDDIFIKLAEAWEAYKSAMQTHANSDEWKEADSRIFKIYEMSGYRISNIIISDYFMNCFRKHIEPNFEKIAEIIDSKEI